MISNLYKFFIAAFLFFAPNFITAQITGVEFGRNRIQYKKMKWKFYEGQHFDVHVNQGGTELGAFVAKMANDELASLEAFIEYPLKSKANIFVYNSYDELKQSNIGLGKEWQNSTGITELPNNKLVVYFDGNHNNLQMQLRQQIAKMLVNNLLFGDDFLEIAGNESLLDLPKWFLNGYINYAAQPWSSKLDDDLRNALLDGDHNTFASFAFENPNLAGQAFFKYLATKYKKENVTYFFYLTRLYKSINAASIKICKKKLKYVLREFMEEEQNKYYDDLRQRRNQPKGSVSVTEDVSKTNYFRFQANPNARNNAYSVVEFHKGVYSIKLIENFYDVTVLESKGIRKHEGDINPNYPILAWDPKGTKMLVILWEAGKTKMYIYDVIAKYKKEMHDIEGFDQILDANFMLDDNTLVLSATKNGHSDIYTYKINEKKTTQITNDIYDDLNPTFVNFPNRSGIIYSSNRPSVNASLEDTVLPSRYNFNIYLVDILNNTNTKQITKLTNVKFGNATSPMQYNTYHFTFVSDENGIANRWAGFFSSQRNGLDTLYYVGDELLRNPTAKDLDSSLIAWQKTEPDSISYFQVYKDSTYSFPITNYQSSLLETRTAGNNGQVSETRREGDYKYLYKLKVNEDALYKRNVNAKPTTYMKEVMGIKKQETGKGNKYIEPIKVPEKKTVITFFQNEFANEPKDTNATIFAEAKAPQPAKAKLFNSKLKFGAENVLTGLDNTILINRFQTYEFGQGPIKSSTGNGLNFALRLGTSDLMEDYTVSGGVRLGSSLDGDKDIFLSYKNYKRRLDWGLTYYRSNKANVYPTSQTTKLITNIYQAYASYPFDETRSLRLIAGIRRDRGIMRPYNNVGQFPRYSGLITPDTNTYFVMSRLEYVHDNSLAKATNINIGTKWKVYLDVMLPAAEQKIIPGQNMFNFGFELRKYIPIYRNCIWATRFAADFSWGERKIVYYVGGAADDLIPKFNNNNAPASDQSYSFQALAVNLRGYNQNVANGNNAFVINSEIRLPIFSTLINTPTENTFLSNLQLVQFLDLGTAWNGAYNGIKRPTNIYTQEPITVKVDAGGLGPFAGGYGFGIRSMLLGYFVKFDVGWPMKGFFVGKPVTYLSLGFDF
jgi:hypothetical protein